MGQMKRNICAFFFWTKVLIAISISLGAIAFQSYLIYYKRGYALAHPPLPNSKPPVIPFPGIKQANASICYSTAGARLDPPSFLFGFDLQWDRDKPSALVSRLGKKPGIFNSFININDTDFQIDTIIWNAQMAGEQGSILEITLMPTAEIETISDKTLYAVAVTMRHINSLYGTPVLLRYAHEMNGNWMIHYGMRPIQMKQSFATLARYVHQLTNMTAMVWSPNNGYGYPFNGDGFDNYNPKLNDPDPLRAANFKELDTNNDGVLTNQDDPYLPYYPGDEYVDWVGLSIYNTARDPRTRQTAPASANIVAAYLINPSNPRLDFYTRFASSRNKPFMLSETGSSYVSNAAPGDTSVLPDADPQAAELAVKQSWWNSILTGAVKSNQFPLWKAAVWFEESKMEQSYDKADVQINRDYRITYSDQIKNAFLNDISGLNIAWADNLAYACSGVVGTRRKS